MMAILVFVAIFAAVFGLGAASGVLWMLNRQINTADEEGWMDL